MQSAGEDFAIAKFFTRRGSRLGKLCTAIAAATVTAFAPVQAEPLPLNIQFVADGDDLGVVKDIYMNIPVNDTTQPVYGGVVRYYDVAIAQKDYAMHLMAGRFSSCTRSFLMHYGDR